MHTAQLNLTYGLKPLRTSIPGFDELEIARGRRILEHLEEYAFWFGTDDIVTRLQVGEE
jgi:hypothetical protein